MSNKDAFVYCLIDSTSWFTWLNFIEPVVDHAMKINRKVTFFNLCKRRLPDCTDLFALKFFGKGEIKSMDKIKIIV